MIEFKLDLKSHFQEVSPLLPCCCRDYSLVRILESHFFKKNHIDQLLDNKPKVTKIRKNNKILEATGEPSLVKREEEFDGRLSCQRKLV